MALGSGSRGFKRVAYWPWQEYPDRYCQGRQTTSRYRWTYNKERMAPTAHIECRFGDAFSDLAAQATGKFTNSSERKIR